jgi:hypothetical protein
VLAYPNGTTADYDHTSVAAAARAGYAHAVTVIPGWNCPTTPHYEIRRFLQRPERGPAGLATIPADPLRRRRLRWLAGVDRVAPGLQVPAETSVEQPQVVRV